jgi:hypothetical protein
VGHAAESDGVRQRGNVLAKAQRLAKGRHLATTTKDLAGQARAWRVYRLVEGFGRYGYHPDEKGARLPAQTL